jgi:hypothetical protein
MNTWVATIFMLQRSDTDEGTYVALTIVEAPRGELVSRKIPVPRI